MTGILLAQDRYVPPLATVFGTTFGTNSENPTLTDTTDRGLLFAFGSSPGAGDNHRYVTKAKPTASNYDIIARFMVSPLGFNFFQPGLYLSDGTKHIFFGTHTGSSAPLLWSLQWWNNQTSFSSNRLDTSSQSRPPMQFFWLRIGVVSGVPTDYYVSHNGQDWVKLLSEAATGFLTFTQIGFGCNVNRNGGALPIASTPHAYVSLLYWADADIVPGV